MLQKINILGIVLLIIMGSIAMVRLNTNINQGNSRRVLGVLDIKYPVLDQSSKDSAIDETSKINQTAPLSDDKNPDPVEIKLAGDGCTTNIFPSECKIVNSQLAALYLKQCTDQTWDECNFYTYELAKREGRLQYIFQKYNENTDILLDVYSYDIKSGVLNKVKTVLYQSADQGGEQVQKLNQEYEATLDEYGNK